jgi:hypothetical protein
VPDHLALIQSLLSKVHHLSALIGLGAGLIAMTVPKLGVNHRRSGRIALGAMALLLILAFLLLGTYLVPGNPSQGRGAQLLMYLLVLAWMASYSLLAGYRWASPRRARPIPAWDISLAFIAAIGTILSLIGLIWDLQQPPRYDSALMMGPFGSEFTFLVNGIASAWFTWADLRILGLGDVSEKDRVVKHVVRLTMGIYALLVGVILVNIAPKLFPGQDHPGAYFFSLAVPSLLFLPANVLLVRQLRPQVAGHSSPWPRS